MLELGCIARFLILVAPVAPRKDLVPQHSTTHSQHLDGRKAPFWDQPVQVEEIRRVVQRNRSGRVCWTYLWHGKKLRIRELLFIIVHMYLEKAPCLSCLIHVREVAAHCEGLRFAWEHHISLFCVDIAVEERPFEFFFFLSRSEHEMQTGDVQSTPNQSKGILRGISMTRTIPH